MLVAAISEVGLHDIVGDMMGLVLYYFDSNNFGESVQRPDLRCPPLREKDYYRLFKAVLEARHPVSATVGGSSNLGVGEVPVLLDGGKRGNMTKLLSPWKDGTRCSKHHDDEDVDDEAGDEDVDDGMPTLVPDMANLVCTEQSKSSRRQRTRGSHCSIRQIERAHILAHSKICLPSRQRKHYEGTSCGDTITGMELPHWLMSGT